MKINHIISDFSKFEKTLNKSDQNSKEDDIYEMDYYIINMMNKDRSKDSRTLIQILITAAERDPLLLETKYVELILEHKWK